LLRSDAEEVSDTRATNALIADLLFITGGVSAGLAVYFLLTAPDEEAPPAAGEVAFRVVPTSDGAALSLSGLF
jgi:hypothetical protein